MGKKREIEAAKRFEREFKPEVFKKILKNMKCTLKFIKSSTRAKTFIAGAFIWHRTEEGHGFWSKIRASLPNE